MASEDGSGTAVALEDGNSVAAFGGGVGRRLKIAAVLGSGGGGRTCDNGIGVSIVEVKGLLFTTSASVLVRTAREEASDARDVCWQQWQGDRRFAAAVVVVVVHI